MFKEVTVEEKKPALTEKEKELEEENEQKDLELKELLATTRLLEEYQKEEMSGKERRKHMMGKLDDLGVKGGPKEKRALPMALGMQNKAKERDAKRLQDAKDLGIYDKSLKHLYVKQTKKKRDRDPGITNGIGRMKGAMLTIKKRDISRIQSEGTKQRRRK